MRRVRAIVGGLVCTLAGVVVAPTATAATSLGETFVPSDLCSSSTFLQTSSPQSGYTVPFQGVITRWRIQVVPRWASASASRQLARLVETATRSLVRVPRTP